MPTRAIIDKVRRNHALEHATVAVLLEGGVRPPMGGYSTPSGYFIWGRVSHGDVSSAAQQALQLLKAGHSELAISPYCGTNLVTSAAIGGLAAVIASGGKRGLWSSVRGVAAALIAASVMGRPVGRMLQRRFTTLADVAGLEIGTVRMLVKRPTGIAWIRTRYE